MSNNPIVSVVLPTYNRADLLPRAINSVLNQTYKDFELIVVDDGSTDNTKEFISSIRDERIVYLKNEKNLGIQKTLNKGIRESRGKYIARIDDDDQWIDRDKLKKQVDFLESNQDYVLVGTGAIVVDNYDKELYRFYNPIDDYNIRKIILGKNCFLHSSVVFLKSDAMKVGGYDESSNIRHIEDYDLWLKLGVKSKMANLPIYGIKLVKSDRQISSENNKKQLMGYFQMIEKYKKNYPGYIRAFLRSYLRLFLYGYLNFEKIRRYF